MKRNRWIIGCVAVLLSVLGMEKGWATDVSTETELKNAIDNGDSYVRLTADIALSSTLTISSGERTLDLSGKKITYDRTGVSENAVAILVNGGNVRIQNGTIEVRAAKGKQGSLAAPIHYDGYAGYNAICVQLEKGMSLLANMVLISKPGEGGTVHA